MAGLIAKNYSDALFELSNEQNCIEDIFSEITQLSVIFKDNKELIELLCTPTITAEEKNVVLDNIFSSKVSQITLDFLKVVTINSRMNIINNIFDEFKKRYNLENNILEVKVTTVSGLSDNLRSKLQEKLVMISGKKIVLIEEIDKSIIGGIVLSYGNTELDSTIKSRLMSMRAQIDSIIA